MLKRILTGLFVAVVLAGGATVDTAATAAGTPPINYGNSKPLVPPTNAARGAVAGPSEDAATSCGASPVFTRATTSRDLGSTIASDPSLFSTSSAVGGITCATSGPDRQSSSIQTVDFINV